MSLHWENMGSGDTTFNIHYLLRELVFLMWIENPQLGCTGSQILRSGESYNSLAQDHRSCAAVDPSQQLNLNFQNQKLKA